MEVIIFDEIELLETIPGDTFAMSVPAGTLVIDHRNRGQDSSSEPSMRTLQFATFDVMGCLGSVPARHSETQ
jgi:hypothetical protein